MKRAHGVMVRARSHLTARTGTLIAGLAIVWMASVPSLVSAQWSGGPTGPIYYNGGNVRVGTASPGYTFHVYGTMGVNGNQRIWPGTARARSGRQLQDRLSGRQRQLLLADRSDGPDVRRRGLRLQTEQHRRLQPRPVPGLQRLRRRRDEFTGLYA